MRDALLYKIANDPSYADLQQPDEHALLALSVHGSVVHMIPACMEPTDSPPSATAPTGPTEAANALPEQVNNDNDGNERFLGGVLNVGLSHATETEQVRQGVQEIIQHPLHNNENVIDASTPDALHPVNENTPGYMSMAFPTVFLDGTADFNQAQLHKVHLGDYFKHLLQYEDGHFARHRRFL